ILVAVSSYAMADELKPVNVTTSTASDAGPGETLTASEGDNKAERVQVTGSHIKRLAVEGASPVQTVTKKDIEKSGYNSVSDVLRDTTANSFGSMREESGSNAAGAAHVDLRGLGATNTLVLMNGQRLPTDAVTGAVDLNLIPVAAIERVEVLKDGASATYGSDALGGVVNIITKKDFAGTEASLSRTMTDSKGGSRLDVGVVNGVNKENLNLVTVLQYRDNDAVYDRDRPWSKTVQSLTGGPGSYRNATGAWMADSNCPSDQLVTTPQGTFCSFNPADFMTALPKLSQTSLLSEAHYQLNSSVKITARAGGTRRLVNWSYAAAPGTFKIPGAVADHLGQGGTPLPGATPGQDLNVRYRLTELGTRDTEVTTYGYNLFLGGDVALSSDWSLGVSLVHNSVNSTDKGLNGYALTGALNQAIESGAYNPFGASGQKGSLEGTRYTPVEDTRSLLTSSDVKASGPIAEVAGNTISLALGSTVTHQLYKDTFDEKSVNGEVFGNAGSSGGGQRATQALFTELSIPMFDSKAELQLAGRYDHYSDFGSTTNPKAAVLIRPTPQILLRGSVGTGFRAPLMQDLYASTSMGYPTFIDSVACNAEKQAGGATPSCLPQQYQVTSGGNTGLKEEKSLSYNVGAVFEPNRNFNIGADFFSAKLSNVVGISYGDATLAE
ncbi:MAG: TonB-dependent receptor, partial [Bdellovibrionota bacterium]